MALGRFSPFLASLALSAGRSPRTRTAQTPAGTPTSLRTPTDSGPTAAEPGVLLALPLSRRSRTSPGQPPDHSRRCPPSRRPRSPVSFTVDRSQPGNEMGCALCRTGGRNALALAATTRTAGPTTTSRTAPTATTSQPILVTTNAISRPTSTSAAPAKTTTRPLARPFKTAHLSQYVPPRYAGSSPIQPTDNLRWRSTDIFRWRLTWVGVAPVLALVALSRSLGGPTFGRLRPARGSRCCWMLGLSSVGVSSDLSLRVTNRGPRANLTQ